MSQRLNSDGVIRFVQFPHPGKEHGINGSGVRPWPLGDALHRRTFLRGSGVHRETLDGPDLTGDVSFWGEWEGEARLITELDRTPEGPSFLCAPSPKGALPTTSNGTPPQNTDPFVWGKTMTYIGCKQPRNRKLRQLGRGSVIVFGSNLGGRFVLDTVLVVADWAAHDHDNYVTQLAGIASAQHMKAGIKPFHGWNTNRTLRYYQGATPANDVNGMYSFVPCRLADGATSGFARPTLELDDYINPNLKMGARSSEPLTIDHAARLWRQVVDQVLDQKLALATHLDL